ALPGPRPPARRPDPGGRDRPEPRRREVRLAQGFQVLDLRDLVDSPGLPACGLEPVRDDPRPDARTRAAREAEPGPPAAAGCEWRGANARGARSGDRSRAALRRGGARRGRGVRVAEPDRKSVV